MAPGSPRLRAPPRSMKARAGRPRCAIRAPSSSEAARGGEGKTRGARRDAPTRRATESASNPTRRKALWGKEAPSTSPRCDDSLLVVADRVAHDEWRTTSGRMSGPCAAGALSSTRCCFALDLPRLRRAHMLAAGWSSAARLCVAARCAAPMRPCAASAARCGRACSAGELQRAHASNDAG